MHDAVHSSYSKAEKINKFLSFFSMFLLGSSVFTWKIQHNILHHTYTNIDGHDHDIDSKGPIRLSDHVPIKPIHRFQYLHAFFFYGLMSFSKLMSDFRQMREYTREGFSKRYNINPTTAYIRMVVAKIGYLALFIGLPVWLTPFSGWQIFSAFMIMHWTGGFIMSTIFQMAHIVEGASQYELAESGVVPTDWAVHQLYTTSDFARGNQFLNWYVGGLNFQIEHHLFPNISHVHYQKIAPIVERTAQEYGLFYNLKPTLSSAFWSHVRRLKQLGGVPV
jgi:linoleoyl-CoA desaturase